MVDFSSVAYAVLGVTSVASAVRLGHWLLNAPPRTIIDAGRWLLIVSAVAAVGLLIWLSAGGRWTVALLPAAFLVPLLVRGALRWQLQWARWRANCAWPCRAGAAARRDLIWLEESRFWPSSDPQRRPWQRSMFAIERTVPGKPDAAPRPRAAAAPGDATLSQRMSRRRALDILGLADDADPAAIDVAYRRLVAMLRPESGGSAFLVQTVCDARAALIGDRSPPSHHSESDDAGQ